MGNVRAIDVGFGVTKYTLASYEVGSDAARIPCGSMPSLAVPVLGKRDADDVGRGRNTSTVAVNGIHYEVGPEVELGATDFRPRLLHDQFTETNEYQALLLGAMGAMRVPHIDALVLGLPVAGFRAKRTALQERMRGTFEVAKGRVEVKKVLVVAQPEGALALYASASEKTRAAARHRCLVLDVGSRTLDWLVVDQLRIQGRLSDSINRGVVHVMRALGQSISETIGEPFDDLESLDQALRQGRPLRVGRHSFDSTRLQPLIDAVTMPAIGDVIGRLEAISTYEHVLLVGGGAHLFRNAVKRHLPKRVCHEPREPRLANVRGFQMLGEKALREQLGSGKAAV